MTKSTIVLWLDELADLCITHIRSENHFNFKKSYKSFVDYSEFAFSVLNYKSGSYATQVSTGSFFSLFDYIFRIHHEIIEEVCKQPEKNEEYVRDLFRFYIRFLKYAVGPSDLSKIVEWQLTSYFRYREKRRIASSATQDLTMRLVESHEEALRYLPNFLDTARFDRDSNATDYYKAISHAYLTSMRWLMRLYVGAVYDHDQGSYPIFRDCILTWPETVLRSLDKGNYFDRQRKEFLTSKDMNIDSKNKSTENLKEHFYKILSNFRTDIILLGLIKELEYLVESNANFPSMEGELKNLWQGRGVFTTLDDARRSPPFKDATSLFVSYIRVLFVDEATMHDIYSRLFYQITEERGLSGRVQVRAVPSLKDVSLVPFLYLISSFQIHEKFVERLVNYLEVLPPNILSEVSEFIPKLVSKISSIQETDTENLYKRAALFTSENREYTFFDENLRYLKECLNQVKASLQQSVSASLQQAEIDNSKLLDMAAYASFEVLVPKHTGVIVSLFKHIAGELPQGKRFNFSVKNWSKRELLKEDNSLHLSIAGAESYFSDIGKHCIHILLYREVFKSLLNNAEKREAATPQGYWSTLKNLVDQYSQKGEDCFLLLDNGTRPRWLYDWCDEYGGLQDYERPKDFAFSKVKEYKDQSGYIGTINNKLHVIYFPGFVPDGKSLVFSASGLKKFSLRKFESTSQKTNYFIVDLIEQESSSDVVDLQFTCEYAIEANLSSPSYLINHRDEL